MSGYLDIETWNRHRQFEFFRDYENPFFNVCANLDVSRLWRLTRAEKSISFFIAYHFFSIKAANQVEQFRYRLRSDGVFAHDRIHAGTTLLLADETFTFVYFDYTEDFEAFHVRAKTAIEIAKTGGSSLDERADRDDLIYHSVIPWVTFTSISHAREGRGLESVPKIAFGKCRTDGDRTGMPVSVEVHHALMDGLHVGRYFEKLESYFADPRSALNL